MPYIDEITMNPTISGTLSASGGDSDAWSTAASWIQSTGGALSAYVGNNQINLCNSCIIWGSSTPTGCVSAPTGSMYIQVNNGTAVPFINIGSDNTGWRCVCLA